jgi:hypothetical protein
MISVFLAQGSSKGFFRGVRAISEEPHLRFLQNSFGSSAFHWTIALLQNIKMFGWAPPSEGAGAEARKEPNQRGPECLKKVRLPFEIILVSFCYYDCNWKKGQPLLFLFLHRNEALFVSFPMETRLHLFLSLCFLSQLRLGRKTNQLFLFWRDKRWCWCYVFIGREIWVREKNSRLLIIRSGMVTQPDVNIWMGHCVFLKDGKSFAIIFIKRKKGFSTTQLLD